MSRHQEPIRSCVLHVSITHLIYPVTEKVLGQLFDTYGVNDVCMVQQSNHLEAFVEFQSWHEASEARGALHGRYIYDGCCLLDIQHAPVSISVMRLPNSELIVVDWDQVEVAPVASSLSPSASTPETPFAVITSTTTCEVFPGVQPATIGPIIDKALDCEVLVLLPAPHDASTAATTSIEEAHKGDDVFPASVGCIMMAPTIYLLECFNQAHQHSGEEGFRLVFCKSQGVRLETTEWDPGIIQCPFLDNLKLDETSEVKCLLFLAMGWYVPYITYFSSTSVTFGNNSASCENEVPVGIEWQDEHKTAWVLLFSIFSSGWCFTRRDVHSVSRAPLLLPRTKLVLVLTVSPGNAFYLPGSYMYTHFPGEDIWAKVNSLTSFETKMMFSYYSLLYRRSSCTIKKSAMNLGLKEHDAKLLKQRSNDLYQVNMMLDNLSVMCFSEQNIVTLQLTCFPLGYTLAGSADDYSMNHLKLELLVHEYKDRNVEIISTGEQESTVIWEMDKLGEPTDDYVGRSRNAQPRLGVKPRFKGRKV